MTAVQAPVWLLLGHRTGDNNQLLRLARELEIPFRAIELQYNSLSRIPPGLLGSSFVSLDKASWEDLRPPWPKLVMGIGNRSVAAALAIRELSGGRSKLVRLGNPRANPARFDLVITTAQYPVADAPNVIRLPVGLSTADKVEPTRDELESLERLPRPHRLLLIGGDTFMWRLRPELVASATSALRRKHGGSVIAVRSHRTSAPVIDAVARSLRGSEHALIWGGFPRYGMLLSDADEIHVTADSVAMISDAVATGKPVGLMLPERTAPGRFFYALSSIGIPVPVRDVRRFWTGVQAMGLAGSVEEPLAGDLPVDPLKMAVDAVRSLLD